MEGDTEFGALPRLHKDRLIKGCPPLKAINLGGVGSHLLPIGVAQRVKPKVIQHQVKERSPIVVVIDREDRPSSAMKFAADVATELHKLLLQGRRPTDGVMVVVADRAFEAWILADARGLHQRNHFKTPPGFHKFEGELGLQRRKGAVELTLLLGRPYDKARDGVNLFTRLDFAVARRFGPQDHGSASLHEFLCAIGV